MQGQFNLTCTKRKSIASKSRVFICIGAHGQKLHSYKKVRIIDRCFNTNQATTDIAAINCLCHERNAHEEPELLVNESASAIVNQGATWTKKYTITSRRHPTANTSNLKMIIQRIATAATTGMTNKALGRWTTTRRRQSNKVASQEEYE